MPTDDSKKVHSTTPSNATAIDDGEQIIEIVESPDRLTSRANLTIDVEPSKYRFSVGLPANEKGVRISGIIGVSLAPLPFYGDLNQPIAQVTVALTQIITILLLTYPKRR